MDSATLRLVHDGRGGFSFFGAGVHRICDPFYRIGGVKTYQKGVVKHGDLTLAVVEQGQIGYASDKGQPILLPPGLHQWRSPTMAFEGAYDLNNNAIRMGPLTLVTVDSGYSAVTEDNGEQKVLKGGHTYLLTHRNWKFQSARLAAPPPPARARPTARAAAAQSTSPRRSSRRTSSGSRRRRPTTC